MIRAGVGLSTRVDSARAAVEAARQARELLAGHPPDWCVVFATSDHAEGLPLWLGALSEACGTPYMAGCSASGVLTTGRECERGPALGVLAVHSDQLRATPFLFHDEGDQGLTAGARLGQRLASSRGTQDLLLVWPDPYHVRPDRLLHSLDATLGQLPIAGGAASASDSQQATFQFCGEETSCSAVSGLRLGGSFRCLIGVTQGCRPLGEAVRISGAHENLILEVDERPALAVLRERAPQGLAEDPERLLSSLFVGLLPDPSSPEFQPGEYLVRNILAADPDTGVMAISDRVEEGQYVVFVLREAQAAREDLQRMLDRFATHKTGLHYRFGLFFNCLARGRSLYLEEGLDSRLL
jgi:small ligand-binding sensory domain FIST